MIVNFAIPTTTHYMAKTLPVIVDSILANGISPNQIHVFVNESDENIDEVIDGITYHRNSGLSFFEWLPPKLIIDRSLHADWWFILHDTVKFGINMRTRLYDRITSTPNNIVRLTPNHSNSIGLVHQNIFDKHREFFIAKLAEIDNLSDSVARKVWCISNENAFLNIEPSSVFQDYNNTSSAVNIHYENSSRLEEYFEGIDMTKYKKNFRGIIVDDVNL